MTPSRKVCVVGFRPKGCTVFWARQCSPCRIRGNLLSILVASCCWLNAAVQLHAANYRAKKADIFNETNLLRIHVDIPAEDVQSLSRSAGGRRFRSKPETQATVREGDRVYTNVSIRLKGFSTFRNIDSFP